MLSSIHTLKDIELWFYHLLINENLNFHPDEDFKNYIHIETDLPSYSIEDAELRNSMMESCFEICEKKGADIYEIGLQLLFDRFK